MPRYDDKYKVVAASPEVSMYTIDMPNSTLPYTTFHASELQCYCKNDSTLFPSQELACPGPVITADGEEEWQVEAIIDERKHGRGMQYLVTFTGYGPDHNRWIPRRNLLENEALDKWEARER